MAILTLIAITSSTAWAVTPDVLFEDNGSTTFIAISQQADSGENLLSVSADTHEQSMPGQTCNHGCHVSAHLLGLFSDEPLKAYLPQDAVTYSLGFSAQVTTVFLQGPFRPPLATPLV